MIERLIPPVGDSDFPSLAQLLVDAVESGLERAEDWWRSTVSAARPGAIFLVARDAERIVGTVQLHPAWAPNEPHRAEIVKLLVRHQSRRTGLGSRLMQTIEDAARRSGLSLLTLDTKRGDGAERLYRRFGWTATGTIPNFALDPDGTPHDAASGRHSFTPEGWHDVTPRIAVDDPEGLIEFLKQVFGARGDYRPDRPSVMKIGDSMVMVGNTGIRKPMHAFLYVYVEDAYETYRRALQAGAKSLEEPSDLPYGDRRGMVEDEWGNTWQIATHLGDRG
jgi:uncharacterized glyoxalase superfamily protein PhnB/GNAT superfamily N-acetyltransferase